MHKWIKKDALGCGRVERVATARPYAMKVLPKVRHDVNNTTNENMVATEIHILQKLSGKSRTATTLVTCMET
jgi:hypothetical protein